MARKKNPASPSEGKAPDAGAETPPAKPKRGGFAVKKEREAKQKVASLAKERVERNGPRLPARAEAMAQAARELNARHAIIMAGSKVSVMVEKTNPITKRPEIDLVSVADMRTWYANKTTAFADVNPATGQVYQKSEPKSDLWIKSPDRREFTGLTFDPTTTEKNLDGAYNLWNGWGIEAKAGDCSMLLKHILDVWCSGDKEHYEWVLDWCADLVQEPADKKGVALVLKSGEGTGKGIIVNALGKIVGSGYVHITHRRHLVGNFNKILQGALLVFADEAIWAGDKEGEGALKALITDDDLTVEPKGKDSYMVPFPCRVVFASNEDWVIPAGHDSRRYFVLTVSENRKGDTDYFDALAKHIDEGGAAAFLHLLQQRKITRNLRKAPVTEGLIDQRLRSADPIDKFWFEVLDSGQFRSKDNRADFLGVVDKDFVHDCWLHWSAAHRLSYPANKITLGGRLYKLCPILTERRMSLRTDPNTGKGHRPYGYQLPPLSEARAALEKWFGGPLPWSDEAIRRAEEAEAAADPFANMQVNVAALDAFDREQDGHQDGDDEPY